MLKLTETSKKTFEDYNSLETREVYNINVHVLQNNLAGANFGLMNATASPSTNNYVTPKADKPSEPICG